MNSSENQGHAVAPQRRRSQRRRRQRSRSRGYKQPSMAQLQDAVATDPTVVLTVMANGIHPASARIIALDAVTLDPEHHVVQEFYRIFNPGTDPGPQHLHGLSRAQITAGDTMSHVLRQLDKLIDGRTLILHDASTNWGFLYAEARRTMLAAARSNRKKSQENGSARRRRKVGHVPRPAAIVDTLATAQRRGYILPDLRLRTLSTALGLTSSGQATAQRALQPAAQTARELTLLTQSVWEHLAEDSGDATSPASAPLVTLNPEELKADRFGLQHSAVRLAAMKATPTIANPGLFTGHIQPGMVFALAPEVSVDPDELITAGTRAGMFYVEKLTRETSLVVTNAGVDKLYGKAMHAHRKGIPLVTDHEFLRVTAEAVG